MEQVKQLMVNILGGALLVGLFVLLFAWLAIIDAANAQNFAEQELNTYAANTIPGIDAPLPFETCQNFWPEIPVIQFQAACCSRDYLVKYDYQAWRRCFLVHGVVEVPVEEYVAPNGQTYKEHWEASKLTVHQLEDANAKLRAKCGRRCR